MYGNYTPVSNMTKATEELVKEFHSRSLSSWVIYGDAMSMFYLWLRRDARQKDWMGINVIRGDPDYRLFPSESCGEL